MYVFRSSMPAHNRHGTAITRCYQSAGVYQVNQHTFTGATLVRHQGIWTVLHSQRTIHLVLDGADRV